MVTVNDQPTSAAEATTELRLVALERQLAGLAGRLQLAEEQNLALESRITDLTDSVADLHAKAFVLKSLTELRLELADLPQRGLPPARPSRWRHLQAVPGGAR